MQVQFLHFSLIISVSESISKHILTMHNRTYFNMLSVPFGMGIITTEDTYFNIYNSLNEHHDVQYIILSTYLFDIITGFCTCFYEHDI